jgi:hypothetical protein
VEIREKKNESSKAAHAKTREAARAFSELNSSQSSEILQQEHRPGCGLIEQNVLLNRPKLSNKNTGPQRPAIFKHCITGRTLRGFL